MDPETTLSYSLLKPSQVAADIYDLQGSRLERALSGWFAAGGHRLALNLFDLPSGVYFAGLKAEGAAAFVKLVLLKQIQPNTK